jgi:PAS domain S-box-containing protein
MTKKRKPSGEASGDEKQKVPDDLYRDLVENTDDLVQTISPEGRFLYVNTAWSKTLGYKPEEISDLSLADIIHRDSLSHRGTLLKSLVSGRSSVKGEAELVAKSGRKVVVEISAHKKLVNGKPVYIQCILRDISERRKMEETLSASEKKYFDLYQNAPDGYHSIGPDGTILEVNDTWVSMLGYERQEVVRKMNFTDIIAGDGKKVFRETFSALKKQGTSEHVEQFLRKKDGSFLPVLINATAIYDEKGKFLKSRSIVRDISARVHFKSRLEQAVSEWRITFDSMPYGVMLIDKDFHIMRVNQYIQGLYGIPFESIVGKKYYELVYHDNVPVEGCPLTESMTNFCTRTYEYCDKILKRYFMLQATPIPDEEGLIRAAR